MRFHDITLPLENGLAPYPGDPPFERTLLADCPTDGYKLSALSLTTHTGTHIDAPAHLYSVGKTLDQYPLNRFYLKALVVEWMTNGFIPPESCAGSDLSGIEALLFKTANGRLSKEAFSQDYTFMLPETARFLVEKGVRMVGLDYASVDPPNDHDLPVHRILLESDVLILENIVLSMVMPGPYTLCCPPLKISGADGAPCRAFLIEI